MLNEFAHKSVTNRCLLKIEGDRIRGDNLKYLGDGIENNKISLEIKR